MATTAQRFYHSTTDQDFTAPSEVDIRKLVESAPGSNATTICSHPNAAGTTQITLDPYTNSSTQSDIRINAGWAINRLGSDGMESTSTEKRRIVAGTWTFTATVTLPQAGTVTGSLTASLLYRVYRVDSSGNRTLLFSVTSNTFQTTGLSVGGATGLLTATFNPGEIILEANETIHVGAQSNVVQVAGTLGATVAGTATYTVGTATEYVEVATPGVRTLYIRAHTATGVGVAKIQRKISLTLTAITTGVAAFSKLLNLQRFSATYNKVRDETLNRLHGTISGTNPPGLVASPFSSHNNAFVFDGVNIGANSAGIDVGANLTGMAGSFCFEFRVRFANVSSNDQYMGRWGASSSELNFRVGIDNTASWKAQMRKTGSTASLSAGGGNNAVVNTNYAIAITYDGTTFRMFKDGVIIDSVAATAPQTPDATTSLWVGRVADTSAPTAMNAIIDEVRLSNTARYTSNYTPASTPLTIDDNTVFLYHLDQYLNPQMIGVATIQRKTNKFFLATGVGVATIQKKVYKFFVVTATGIAAIQKRVYKFFTVTLVGVASFSKFVSAFRAFTVSMVGVAGFARRFIGVRAFTVTLVGIAKTFVYFSTDILNRITGGGTIIIRRIQNWFYDED